MVHGPPLTSNRKFSNATTGRIAHRSLHGHAMSLERNDGGRGGRSALTRSEKNENKSSMNGVVHIDLLSYVNIACMN